MGKNIVQVDYNSNKYYEMDKLDAMDMLHVCFYKAACLSYCAPKLFDDGIGKGSPASEGLAFILSDLTDELEIITKVLGKRDEEETEKIKAFKDLLNHVEAKSQHTA